LHGITVAAEPGLDELEGLEEGLSEGLIVDVGDGVGGLVGGLVGPGAGGLVGDLVGGLVGLLIVSCSSHTRLDLLRSYVSFVQPIFGESPSGIASP
jgi:hypothetical protein